MKALIPSLVGVLALTACAATPHAQTAAPAPAPAPVHTVLPAKDVKWSPAPASLPPGAQISLLQGDPSKPEVFVLRLRFPKGYHLPAHTHPGTEIVTVISGVFKLGEGESADPKKTQALNAGSFFAFSPGMAHYAYTDTDTVVQLSTMGPWSLKYVNAADDPRNKK